MERILKNLEPSAVFSYFEDLTRIPHGSGNVEAISNYCVNFAKEHGLSYVQDDLYNVVIIKEASAGYPSNESLMIQGHIDMVCEKNSDNPIDMTKDPLSLAIDGDWIHANGTTLGGDDGIAVAYALAILADKEAVHPRLEVILTTDEETGMDGAAGLDTSALKAKYMINIDSEEEGFILTGCAGGNKTITRLPIQFEPVTGSVCSIKISGLQGGHSGVEIDKGRGNATIILGRVLHALKSFHISLVSLTGGLKDNAIPRESEAKLVIDSSKIEEISAVIKKVETDIKNEYLVTDPNLCITFTKEEEKTIDAFTKESTQKAAAFLFQVIDGIQSMSFDIAGMVESSLNLGIMKTEESQMIFSFAIRSSKKSRKALLTEKVGSLIELLGGSYNVLGDYPEWEYKPDSPLRQLSIDKYIEITGKSPEICAIHAGLECGLFAEKIKGLDMVSIGPDMMGIHTPKERLNISSTSRTYTYILAILKDFGTYCK